MKRRVIFLVAVIAILAATVIGSTIVVKTEYTVWQMWHAYRMYGGTLGWKDFRSTVTVSKPSQWRKEKEWNPALIYPGDEINIPDTPEIKTLRDEIEQATKQIKTFRDKIKKLQQSYQKEKELLEAKYNEQKKQTQAAIILVKMFEKKANKLKKENAVLNSNLEKTMQNLEIITKKYESLKISYTKIQAQGENLTKKLNAANLQIQKLLKDYSTLETMYAKEKKEH
ncbi:hypothetical protein J7J81_00930, partial [bacterium]|nr:hypothetical protein [bacterium]